MRKGEDDSRSPVNWLQGSELETFITKNADAPTRAIFLGVFAVNTLPIQHLSSSSSNLPALLIVNSDTANLAGQHWRAIYIDTERHGEIFDSLALAVSPILEAWINRQTINWITSDTAIQHPRIPSCGAFALHFVIHRLAMGNLKTYLDTYFPSSSSSDSDFVRNELFIRDFVRTLSQ